VNSASNAPVCIEHHPRLHAAVRTKDYLFSQLIPYIGNKRKLLPLIAEGIALCGERGDVRSGARSDAGGRCFVDLFAGSTVVSRLAKAMGFHVVANDWEPYSYQIARATVALNRPPAFEALGGAAAALDLLNRLPPLEGYVATHLCPRSDEAPDVENERLFFTRANGMRIDAVGEQIAAWERAGLLSGDERAYLLAPLVYAVSYVSNTSGVFKGFHRGWGGRTGTALYRILSDLTLRPPVLHDNGLANLALREDAQTLAGSLKERLASAGLAEIGERPAVVYIDPPYNQHPYGSNYHVLNTVVLWDKPPLNPRIRVDGRKVEKSAIRKDWRTQRRSPYNSAAGALPAFRKLTAALDADWILASYSTDGNMPLEGLLAALADRGTLTVLKRRYKRYRVSTPRMSPKSHNVEFLAVVDTRGKSSVASVGELATSIRAAEEG
jgi:adenine-specific DNA-methyltransferase